MDLEEITIEEACRDAYWKKHEEYLIRDIFPNSSIGSLLTQEDKEYFLSEKYRNTLISICNRETDPAHMIFFYKGEVQIGFCSYCVYTSEDGKCFILDFCIYPEYRTAGYGKACFDRLRKEVRGAKYFELNLSNERNRRFWMSLGFRYNGYDENGSALYMLMQEATEEVVCEELKEEDYCQILKLYNGYMAEREMDLLTDDRQDELISKIERGELSFFVGKCATRVVGMYCAEAKLLFVEPLFRDRGIEKQLMDFRQLS
ncbi:MAG: GNAT family N-acetyltransferase [Clostridiales bacterium]|mgnify:CR=1 FL=1|nr:GNAT family N-acetyltransferase [Clostridiales bacterium]